MSESFSEQPNPPKRQAVKVTGITFILTSVSNKITDPFYRDWFVSLSPIIGYALHLIYAIVCCEISFAYFNYRIKSIVTDLNIRKRDEDCSAVQIREINKAIDEMHRKLRERRLKDLNIKL